MKQVLSKFINQKHSPRAINQKNELEATKVVQVWIHQALMCYLKGFPCGDFNWRGQKLALGVGLSQPKANESAEDASSEEEKKYLVAEADGEGKKPNDGTSALNV